jgi:trimethylamine:corrinoid methyltransferase-like protein
LIKHLNTPFTVNAVTMAWKDILAVGSGGHFLAQPGTLQCCRTIYRSFHFKLSMREDGRSGELKGVIERARQRTLDIWNTKPDPRWIDQEMADELDRIVHQAEGALAC